MPGLVRKLIVFAAVDGLVLQPVAQRNHTGSRAVRLDYGTCNTTLLSTDAIPKIPNEHEIESYGVIGLLNVSSSSYLVLVSQRQQVAQVWGKPVYAITRVDIIPISFQASANKAIKEICRQKAGNSTDSGSDDSDDSDDSHEFTENAIHHSPASTSLNQPYSESVESSATRLRRNSGVVEDVIGKKGAYGRFADSWFSRIGWRTGQRRNLGLSSHIDAFETPATVSSEVKSVERQVTSEDAGSETENEFKELQQWPQTPGLEKPIDEYFGSNSRQLTASLVPKILQTTKLLLGSNTFFFSYDLDITQSLSSTWRGSIDVPLHRQVVSKYFWNRVLALPFITNGLDEYVLPIMQGFVGQRSFSIAPKAIVDTKESTAEQIVVKDATIPHVANEDSRENAVENARPAGDKKYFLTVISRRSVDRAGLRYLRRGVDEDGHVANAVETEQILSTESYSSKEPVYSFLQIRGSIPLFYSQTPYTFKPVPVMHGSSERNQNAMRKHFTELHDMYGEVHAVSLIDKHGTEAKIGEAYAANLETLNRDKSIDGRAVSFEWFEFHAVCRGMKFENVSHLVNSTLPFLRKIGWTSKIADSITKKQSGIIRTNCMDCLDRTNVVQSAYAQYMLEQQLSELGHSIDFKHDPSTSWFNTLWADNGDAVSRAYAGTAALKGDYTRTRQRNMVGALTDLTLTLSRYYHNLFDDFFAQAVIDYLLGTVTAAVFVEFETKMTTADPAIDLRKARQTAISTAALVVVERDEDFLSGWALATPASPNSLRTLPFSEALLLLTDKALYAVRYDWDAEGVDSFERMDLAQLASIQWGTYITETLTPTQMNQDSNVGLVLKFSPPAKPTNNSHESRAILTRTNSRSLENRSMVADAWSYPRPDGRGGVSSDSNAKSAVIWAYKALPPRSAVVRKADEDNDKQGTSSSKSLSLRERDMVKSVVEEIQRAASSAQSFLTSPRGEKKTEQREVDVVEKDIISLSDAKQKTSMLEHLEYNLKKLVWG